MEPKEIMDRIDFEEREVRLVTPEGVEFAEGEPEDDTDYEELLRHLGLASKE